MTKKYLMLLLSVADKFVENAQVITNNSHWPVN